MTSINPTDDTELVKSVQKGDRAAFKSLYTLYAGRIYALTLRMISEKNAADDILQDIFIRAWEKIGTFKFKSSFYTWLHRLAVNVIIRKSQKLKKEAQKESNIEVEEISRKPGLKKTDSIENKIDCERALQNLPDQARKIFILYEMEGYTHEQIGKIAGISTGASKAHLSRARMLLKKELRL